MENLVLDFDLYPISTNDMYVPTAGKLKEGNSRRSAFYRKSWYLSDFQSKMYEIIDSKYKDKINEFLNECKSKFDHLGFKLIIYLGMPHNDFYYKRKSDDLRPNDASNFIKSPEDCLSSYFGVDDKYDMDVRVIKYCSDDDHWKFRMIYTPVDYTMYNKSIIEGE